MVPRRFAVYEPLVRAMDCGCQPRSTVTSSAITATLAASFSVKTIGWYSEFVGDSVTLVWRQLSPSAASLIDEYFLTVNAPPVSGSAGPRYWTRTVFPFRLPAGLARN